MRDHSTLVGKVFNRLTVLGKAFSNTWCCSCICSNTTYVTRSRLKNGHTKSCGCLKKETSAKNAKSHKRTTSLSKFMSNTKQLDNGCLNYTGSNTEHYHGYTKVSWKGKKYQAHRLMYIWTMGNIPKDKIIMHTCDNRQCVNPYHLKLGTNKENSEDMYSKGRQAQLDSEENNFSKLTWDIVNSIRYTYRHLSDTTVATMFNVTPITIKRIHLYKTWKGRTKGS